MQCDDTNFLLTRLSQCLINQVASQLLPPMLRLHIDIQQVAALILARIKRMRWPIEDDQARTSNHLAAFGSQPAEIPSIPQPDFHPWFKVLRHHVENPVVLTPGIHKHAPPVMSDDGCVCGRRCSDLIHARSIAM
jgi:hypothetical protein